MRPFTLAFAVVAAALWVAACGGGTADTDAALDEEPTDEVVDEPTFAEPEPVSEAPGAAAPAQEPPFNQRPADASVVMSTSRRKYDGTYTLSHTALVCGEVPGELNFAGVPGFIVQFPDGGPFEINDITFNSKTLVGGVTTTSEFFLSVNVQSPSIGHPPAYVLDTSRPKMSGTASVTVPSPGSVQLKVDGVNDMGETVDLTLVCGPRP